MAQGLTRSRAAATLVAVASLLVTGCGDEPAVAPLHIYMTGGAATDARHRSMADAARLALEEAKGDVGDTPVKLFTLADRGRLTNASANTRRALADERSRALIQLDANSAPKTSSLTRPAGLLHVTPLDGGRSGASRSISVIPEDYLLGEATADAALYAGLRSGLLTAPAGDIEFNRGARDRAREIGLRLAARVGGRAIAGHGRTVVAADPVDRRAFGREDLLVAPWLAVDEYGRAGKSFFKNYEERYGRRPDPYAIYAYDAMGLILESIKRVQDDLGLPPTREQLIEAAYETRSRVGPVGRYDILLNGNSTLNIFGLYREGSFERIIEIG